MASATAAGELFPNGLDHLHHAVALISTVWAQANPTLTSLLLHAGHADRSLGGLLDMVFSFDALPPSVLFAGRGINLMRRKHVYVLDILRGLASLVIFVWPIRILWDGPPPLSGRLGWGDQREKAAERCK
jgi:hypothetical protein